MLVSFKTKLSIQSACQDFIGDCKLTWLFKMDTLPVFQTETTLITQG
jgi:hypothetical protein